MIMNVHILDIMWCYGIRRSVLYVSFDYCYSINNCNSRSCMIACISRRAIDIKWDDDNYVIRSKGQKIRYSYNYNAQSYLLCALVVSKRVIKSSEVTAFFAFVYMYACVFVCVRTRVCLYTYMRLRICVCSKCAVKLSSDLQCCK